VTLTTQAVGSRVGIDKPEFPPLFTAGFYDLASADDLDTYFVAAFQNQERRRYLVERLRALLEWLQTSIRIEWEVWLDGSFCTHKEEPQDIDIAFFFREADLDSRPPDELRVGEFLASDHGHQALRLRFDCDCYFLARDNDEDRSYWRGWFGFTRDENPKGIPRLWLNRVS
jgi:hypothetical protein